MDLLDKFIARYENILEMLGLEQEIDFTRFKEPYNADEDVSVLNVRNDNGSLLFKIIYRDNKLRFDIRYTEGMYTEMAEELLLIQDSLDDFKPIRRVLKLGDNYLCLTEFDSKGWALVCLNKRTIRAMDKAGYYIRCGFTKNEVRSLKGANGNKWINWNKVKIITTQNTDPQKLD